MKLSDTAKKRLFWGSRVLALCALLGGVVAGWGFLPAIGTQIAGASAALFGIASRWCEQQLPVKSQKADA
jgi:hypothetical protein